MNWQNIIKEVIHPMSGSLKSMFEQQGIDVIMGKGKIVDEYTIDEKVIKSKQIS